MKKTLLLITLAIGSAFTTVNRANAQGMAVNTAGASANSSAMLDVSSTTKGMLIPRMTAAQLAAISSPATGLLVYQTNGTTGFYYYNGSAWTQLGAGGSTVTTSFFGGAAGSNIASGSSAFVFVGPTSTIVLAATSTVTISATAAVGVPNGTTPFTIHTDVCYQNQSGPGSVTNLSGGAYVIGQISGALQTVVGMGSTSLGAATYKVGLCIRNGSTTNLTNNDFVNGFVTVVR